MFVKICGFTDPANLAAVCGSDAAPDAVGLNFWSGSKRFVRAGGAGAGPLAAAARAAAVQPWGVFVNADGPDLMEAPETYDLAGVQLHGDEPPTRFGLVVHLPDGVARVRAWRVGGSLGPLLDHLAAAAELIPSHVLLDAAVPGAYGGTGAKLDWHALRDELDRVGDKLPPVILAGGLTPENVAEAVRIVRPWGVDVAGGVENAPGIKDPAKVAAFCDAARGAL
ncbi:phosphoribosylanthranilate isomerase [Alienimonas sp. DA493]|uniref:phosphoribosylanthranilate isomerase n=1 Tax=Alienimonas sp. DA493 TaxID=3373605 RepID=UPI0037552BEB